MFCRTASLAGPPLAVLIALAASGCATSVRLPRPPRAEVVPPVVAVSSFANRSGFEGQWNLGGGMADLLVSELVQSRHFTVVERQHLDRVVGEIARQNNALFRPEGRVSSGQLMNARYLIRGVINDFSQVSGGSLRVTMSRFLFGGRGSTARVALTLTIVDVESGRILNSVQTAATAKAREAYAAGVYKGVAFGGDAFFRTPLGIATRNAIRRGVRDLIESMPRTTWRPMIASITSAGVLINGGRDRGLRPGMVYTVRKEATAVTDPATGDVIALMPGAAVGVLRVTRVNARIAVAEIVDGQDFKRGQALTPGQPSP